MPDQCYIRVVAGGGRRLVATQGMLSYFLSVSIIAIIFGMIVNLLGSSVIVMQIINLK